MVEESSPLLPPAEESSEAELDTALEPEPKSGEPAGEPGFVCECEEWMRSACEGLAFYKEHESRRYCVLHYPGKEKSADFKAALESKLNNKDFGFRGVYFPDKVDFREVGANASFNSATFSAEADFISATFSGDVDFGSATFSAAANFSKATFRADAGFSSATINGDADFSDATFSAAAYFSDATFTADAYFNDATFSADAKFISATFNTAAYFISATFGAIADFGYATFKSAFDLNDSVFHANATFRGTSFYDFIHFFGSPTERELPNGSTLPPMALGKAPSLDFQHAAIEHPERMAFHTLILRPHWFVNVDSSQFVFTDVDWQWDLISIKEEIASLEAIEVSAPNRLLAIACRQLAENAESNNRYEEASRFRYWAMDLARRTKWEGWSFWRTDWLHILYWAVSGYGERIRNALGVLAAVWFVFVLLYTCVGFAQQSPKASNEVASSTTAPSMTIEDKIGQPLEFSRALTYSLAVMSLQKPEPRPLTNLAHALVTLEAILGPVQGALLLLAIRRKFMR